MKRVVILGAGESGTAAALLAKKLQFEVFVSDFGQIAKKFENELVEAAIAFEAGKHTEASILNADLIIKSPGIPEKAAIIQKIRRANIVLVSEIEFAASYAKAPIIAITGSNGKTTTTALIGHLLRENGWKVAVGGNIGDSFARMCLQDVDYFVLEVSSFQLDDIQTFRPYISILLNITPDHLERYDSFQAYANAKGNIYKNQMASDYLILNKSDKAIETLIQQKKPLAVQKQVMMDAELAQHLEVGAWDIEISNATLKGMHNQFNMKCALIVAQLLQASKEKSAKALVTFQNIPHRLEVVGIQNEVTYINDSKATNVDATKYALMAMTKPLVWIVGGVDKGNNYDEIQMLVKKTVKACVFLGADNQKLKSAFGYLPYEEAKSMAEAVSKATKLAEQGDIVLLSPACASFDLFTNYIDRGDQFRKIVQEK